MRITIKLLSAILLLILVENALSQNTFQKAYRNKLNTALGSGISVLLDSDGGYTILTDNSLIKTDLHGDTLWTRTYQIGSMFFASSIAPTFDSGYLITGQYFDVDKYQPCLMKTDSRGDLVWTKVLLFHDSSIGLFIQETSDSGSILVCYSWSYTGHLVNLLIKTDNSGNFLWSRTYSGDYYVSGYCVQQTKDEGFIISGAYSPDKNYTGGQLIKTNSSGDTLWTKFYGGTLNSLRSVQQTMDGGYITAGVSYTSIADSGDVFLLKTDSNGNPIWIKTFGGKGREGGECVQQTLDGGYIVVGSTTSFRPGSSDIYLIKTDSKGDTLWTKTYGCTGMNYGSSVRQTSDGGYIITGSMSEGSPSVESALLIKTDSLGNSGCNEGSSITITGIPGNQVWHSNTSVSSKSQSFDTPYFYVSSGGTVNTICSGNGLNEIKREENLISVYPNPAKNDFTIKINNTIKNSEIFIYNMLGKECFRKLQNGKKIEIKNATLENGVYLIEVLNKDNHYVKKLIIEKD